MESEGRTVRDPGSGTDGAIGDSQRDGRAHPLPEEAAVARPGEDRSAEAAEILADSERRIAEADAATSPGDAADENRTASETAG